MLLIQLFENLFRNCLIYYAEVPYCDDNDIIIVASRVADNLI